MTTRSLLLLLGLAVLATVSTGQSAPSDGLYTFDFQPEPLEAPTVPAANVLLLNNVFSSNMVLQRTTATRPVQASIWGVGVPGSKVAVTVDGESGPSALVNESGDWEVMLLPHKEALNSTLVVSDGNTTLTLTNVAWGDVVFCSGQSNMQVSVNYTFGGPIEVAQSSNYPNIRLFSVPTQASNNTVPQARIAYSQGWVLPQPSTLLFAPGDFYNYFSAVCWYAGRNLYDDINKGKPADQIVPIGLLQSSYAGSAILPFTSPDAVDICGSYPPPGPVLQNNPSKIYNIMVYPFIRFKLSAVLWYQGETDGGQARYRCAFPAMIQDWRNKWAQPELPFYFVLLAPWGAQSGNGIAINRDNQLTALSLRNTGVASAIDCGDVSNPPPLGDLHPRNKSHIGQRLAQLMEQQIYGMPVVAQGPVLKGITATVTNSSSQNVTLTLQFDSSDANSGLNVMPTPGCQRCCPNQAGLITVRLLNLTNAVFTPQIQLDPVARTITAVIVGVNASKVGDAVQVSLEYETWPQCVLYNKFLWPALPAVAVVYISNPTTTDSQGQSSLPWSVEAVGGIILIAVLLVVAVSAGVIYWKRKQVARGTTTFEGATSLKTSLL